MLLLVFTSSPHITHSHTLHIPAENKQLLTERELEQRAEAAADLTVSGSVKTSQHVSSLTVPVGQPGSELFRHAEQTLLLIKHRDLLLIESCFQLLHQVIKRDQLVGDS